MPRPIPGKSRSFCLCFLFLLLLTRADSQTIWTVAGNGSRMVSGTGGAALNAGVPFPTAVCADAAGNLFICTGEQVRKVEASTGLITVVAGTGQAGSSGDGGPAANARLHSPVGVCIDKSGNLFIAEYNGHRIRKVSPDGMIKTVAGNGTPGYNGDGGKATAAQLNSPWGLAVDATGNLYIADLYNHRIRKVDAATGVITTLAGNGISYDSGDGGPCTQAGLACPSGLAVDKNDNLYFTESAPEISSRLRKIDLKTNRISTVAGNRVFGYDGDGGPAAAATLFAPTGVAVDAKGNLYLAEYNDSRIRKIDAASGKISTLAGNGTQGFCCDGSNAAKSLLNNPMAIACDGTGNLYVADHNNHRIRKISPLCTQPTLNLSASFTLFCYNAMPTFTADITGDVIQPVYHWFKNDVHTSDQNATAVITVAPNDVVRCEVSGINSCGDSIHSSSNSITIQSNPGYNQGPEVTITADKNQICAGTNVQFTATNVSQSANPVFRWLVNGVEAGTNNAQFLSAALADGDKVECVMTVPHCGNNGGSTKDYSNAIVIHVAAAPKITFNPPVVSVERGQQATLTPTISGAVSQYQWTPASLLVNASSLTPATAPLTSNTRLQLWVKTTEGCEDTASVAIEVNGKLYLPTGFTPNGDGKNDVFRIPAATGFQLTAFSIFDRWGNCLFSTTDIAKGWDGKKNGQPLAPDTYAYLVSGKDKHGNVVIKGTVQLIR